MRDWCGGYRPTEYGEAKVCSKKNGVQDASRFFADFSAADIVPGETLTSGLSLI